MVTSYDLNDGDDFKEAPFKCLNFRHGLWSASKSASVLYDSVLCYSHAGLSKLLSATHLFMGYIYQLRTTYLKGQGGERDNKDWADRLCKECYGPCPWLSYHSFCLTVL
jgi:hypothetical protein